VDNVRVLASLGLNLRDGPGIDYNIITLLNLDEALRVTGVSEDGEWWRVLCPDGTLGNCWISSDPTLSETVTFNQVSLAGIVYGEVNGLQRWMVNTEGEASLLVDAQSLQSVRGPISPDGRYLIRGISRGDTNLYLDDLRTGDSLQLTDTPDRLNFNPVWWPENPAVVIFMSRELGDASQPGQPGPANLATVRTDGSGFQVLDDEHISHSMQPSLAPDGRSIAYDHGGETASDDGILTPWIYQLDGTTEPFDYSAYGLEEFPGLSFGSPAWSPDGRYLSWVVGGDLTGDGEWQVAIANFDLQDSTVQILNPYEPGSCLYVWCFSAPVWSPDGDWLAWDGFPSGSLPGFWVMRPDGAIAIFITDGGAPIWSPNGNSLAFNKNNEIQVMETGVWQPQSSGLPAGNMIMDWLNPDLNTGSEGASLDESKTLACTSVGPGSAEYMACNVQDSLLSRNLAPLGSYMADPFILGYWGSEGISDTPEAIIEQIRGLYNYDAPDYTPRLTFTTDREKFPPLQGTPPESMFGPEVNVTLVVYSEGWGPEGEGAALFMIAEDQNGEYYLHGMAFSHEQFDK
jgi:Tol biopolymer transport system component